MSADALTPEREHVALTFELCQLYEPAALEAVRATWCEVCPGEHLDEEAAWEAAWELLPEGFGGEHGVVFEWVLDPREAIARVLGVDDPRAQLLRDHLADELAKPPTLDYMALHRLAVGRGTDRDRAAYDAACEAAGGHDQAMEALFDSRPFQRSFDSYMRKHSRAHGFVWVGMRDTAYARRDLRVRPHARSPRPVRRVSRVCGARGDPDDDPDLDPPDPEAAS
jgi:hypothetical protein